MIRKGTLDDMPQIESLFDEHFQYQKKYESYTINQRGIFPSTEGLTNAVKNGVLYVREDDGEITAMIVLDNQQPPEFDNIDWLTKVPADGARPRIYRLRGRLGPRKRLHCATQRMWQSESAGCADVQASRL